MLNIYCKMKIAQLKNKEEISYNNYYTNAMKNMESVRKKSKDDIPKCRVCLQKASIYIIDDDKTEVIEALQTFVNINMNEDDESPKHLCRICFKFIREAILFRNTAVKAGSILRKSKLCSKTKQKIKKEGFNEVTSDGDDRNDQDFHDTNNEITIPPKQLDTQKKGKETKENSKQTSYKAKTVPCPICNKIYFKAYLNEHITIHEQVKPLNHVCDTCGKAYRLKTSLARHITSHRKGFPYKCKFCPYKAKDVESLKLHNRVHTRDYKYRCDQCPAKYIAKPNLNRHLLTHKEPQFKCESCPKSFYTNADLRNHNEAVHLGMKKHICNLCDKAFGFRKLMMRHQRHFHKREKMKTSRVPKYLQEGEST